MSILLGHPVSAGPCVDKNILGGVSFWLLIMTLFKQASSSKVHDISSSSSADLENYSWKRKVVVLILKNFGRIQINMDLKNRKESQQVFRIL